MIRYFKIISQSFSAAIFYPSVNFFYELKIFSADGWNLGQFSTISQIPSTSSMYWNTSFTYTCTFKMSIVSVQGLLAYSANCTFRDHWNLWQVYMSFQLIKTRVNKSIVRYILVRKTCANVFIKPTLFFHILRAQKKKY